MPEKIVTNKKYRILTDPLTKTWTKIAFWTTGDSVELSNNRTVAGILGNYVGVTDATDKTTAGQYIADASAINKLTTTVNGIKSSFQAGVDIIYNAIVKKGQTPVSKTPEACAEAIAKIGGSSISAKFTNMSQDTFVAGGSSVAGQRYFSFTAQSKYSAYVCVMYAYGRQGLYFDITGGTANVIFKDYRNVDGTAAAVGVSFLTIVPTTPTSVITIGGESLNFFVQVYGVTS